MSEKNNTNNFKRKLFNIIEIGNRSDIPSTVFDIFIVIMIILNLSATLASTFEQLNSLSEVFRGIEIITCGVFTVEYLCRLWTSDYLYPQLPGKSSMFRFVFSFYGIIDLLTFLPMYLPLLFPSGVVAFRMLRVFRILRLFKINAQYDAFNVITQVLYEKKNQLFSSITMILILMVASSLTMYGFEHDAQPEVFRNAFSGIWWSVSTLLTIGYGDIYPVTLMGKVFSMIISFLGVGMVAIPTGIISAGFVEQYTAIKSSPDDCNK